MVRSVRHTSEEDIPSVLRIYDNARARMRLEGNDGQWLTQPDENTLRKDMGLDSSYVITEDGEVVGTFYLSANPDPAYAEIEGKWMTDGPYYVIHRIAGDGIHRGILKTAVSYALNFTSDIRIDTHEKNVSMQSALRSLGFVRCGTVYIKDERSDRSPRIGFELVK